MSQASAQREPSMEEILASIRRIIEDSDGGGAAESVAGARPKPGAAQPMTPRPAPQKSDENPKEAVETAPSVERPTFHAANPGTDTDADMDTGSGEPLPSVASGPDVDDNPDRAPDFSGSGEESSATRDSDPVETLHGEDGPPPDVFRTSFDVDAEAAFRKMEQNLNYGDETQADEYEEPEPVAANANPKNTLVSESTGRSVAASFGHLTDAVAQTRRKSYDEIAEEILRPMLQDWLDNNLPHLVERLVREEIERVARGHED